MTQKSTSSILLLVVAFNVTTSAFGQAKKASAINKKGLSAPEISFESFWKTFDDNYAFFSLRNINWKQSYTRFRNRISPGTTDDSLFNIFTSMVTPFEDEHINIYIPDKRQFSVRKPSRFLQEYPDSLSQAIFWNVVDSSLSRYNFSKLSLIGPREDNRPLFYISESSDYGYIRSLRCYVTSKTEDKAKRDARIASLYFDNIIDKFKGKKGIILDIRLNEGGNDEFAYAIANRFVAAKTIGHYKQTRKGGYEDFETLQSYHLTPAGKKPFIKPLIVLTNDQTASAADVLALISKELPAATIIGEPSSGIFSDMYFFELPNKWVVSLSNQRYYSSKMICYETLGVPVDLVVRNSKNDIIHMNDPVLQSAIEALIKQTK